MAEMVIRPKGQKYRGKNDPYNDMDSAEIRPDYIARQELSDAEKSAAKEQAETHETPSRLGRSHDSINRIRARERNQRSSTLNSSRSSFRNSVAGTKGQGGRAKFASKGRGRLRRFAPITIIFSLLLGGGGLFLASQSAIVPQLSNLYTEATDLQFTSRTRRSTRLFKYLMDGGDQISNTILGRKYTTFSPFLIKRLNRNNIQVGHLNDAGEFVSSSGGISTRRTVLKYGDDIIDADSFQTRFASDIEFRDAYTKAKRGRVAGFFDDAADRYYSRKGATRDIFNRYRQTGDSETDNKSFRDTVSNRVTTADGSVNSIGRHENEDGEEVIEQNGDNVGTRNIDGDTPELKAQSFVNRVAGKVGEFASDKGVKICGGLRILNMISVTVSAIQIFQAMAYFQSLIEPFSKSMAGEGDASAINPVLNFLTTETTSQVQYVNADGTTAMRDVTGSPLQSAGSKLIMADTLTPQAEVAPYSIDNITKAAKNIAIGTGATTTFCSGVNAAAAIVSLASNFVPGGTLANFAVKAIINTVGNIVITGIVSTLISAVIPYVAKIFAGNIFESYTGIPAGEFFTLGAGESNFKLATEGSGYMPADAEYINEQNKQTVLALAEEAELNRHGRSPFDITSKNTFLGSLLRKFSTITSSNTIFGHFSHIASTLTRSFNILNPAASAYGEEVSFTSNYQECENLEGATCNMYGTVIPARDYSTLDLDPNDPTYRAVIEPNLDTDGNIIEGSELSKFINYCADRESPWGVLDAQIMNAIQTSLGTIGDNAYISEDIMDIVNAAEDVKNRAWGTGEICKMSHDNPRWDNEFRYYQAFVDDMRINSSITNEKNTVSIYREKHDAEHPLDTSYEGTLARITGYSKDDIAYLLEVVRYASEVANYDYGSYYQFSPVEQNENKISFTEQISNPIISVSAQPTIYLKDRRNYTV